MLIVKEKNLTINKIRIKITWRRKSMLYFGKRILKKLSKSTNFWKVQDHCHYKGKYIGASHSICNFKFNVPNEIHICFHNGSSYDYHFIIKEWTNEFKGQFECLGKNTEKYKTYFVLIEREVTKIDKDGNESVFTISYKIKFIESARFMAS